MRTGDCLIIINKNLNKFAKMCMWLPLAVDGFYQNLIHPTQTWTLRRPAFLL